VMNGTLCHEIQVVMPFSTAISLVCQEVIVMHGVW
jgi:hypothetical protein